MPEKVETNTFTLIHFIGVVCILQRATVDMLLFIGRIRHSILAPHFFFFNAAGNKCAVSRNSPSASLLPSVQKLWQFAGHTQLPDANITAGPAAPPAQRAVAKKFSQKPALSWKARLWSVAIPDKTST